MSKNLHTVKPSDGCMVHAGILDGSGELTKGYPNSATEKFIDEVINELVNPGTDPLPCGKPIPPLAPNLAEAFKDLKDEKKFPDFHKNILGNYRDLAQSLNASSNFNLFPVCDPIALGTKLFPEANLKIEKLSDFLKFAIPNPVALAAEFGKAGVKDPIMKEVGINVPLTPIGLLAEFAKKAKDIKKPPVPPVPPVPPTTGPTGGQGQLISGGSTVQSPWQGVEFEKKIQPYDSRGPDLAAQIGAFGINIVTFLPQLIASMPVFVINMITKGPAAALNTICGLVADDSGLVGVGINSPNGEPQDIVMRAARKVLARKVTEMCVFHAMANTIGTSKSGLVGLMAGGGTVSSETEVKSGLIADYTPAADATDNYLVNDAQKIYTGGDHKPGDYITFTNPPLGEAFNDPWRHRLKLGDPLGNTDLSVGGEVYEPRGSEANDDHASELIPMIAGTYGDLEQEFGIANEKALIAQATNNGKLVKDDVETLQEKAKSDPAAVKALKNKQLIEGTKAYKEENGGG
jgi:hypothetical protein